MASTKGGHRLRVGCSCCSTPLKARRGIDLNHPGRPCTAAIGRGKMAISSGGQRKVTVSDSSTLMVTLHTHAAFFNTAHLIAEPTTRRSTSRKRTILTGAPISDLVLLTAIVFFTDRSADMRLARGRATITPLPFGM